MGAKEGVILTKRYKNHSFEWVSGELQKTVRMLQCSIRTSRPSHGSDQRTVLIYTVGQPWYVSRTDSVLSYASYRFRSVLKVAESNCGSSVPDSVLVITVFILGTMNLISAALNCLLLTQILSVLHNILKVFK